MGGEEVHHDACPGMEGIRPGFTATPLRPLRPQIVVGMNFTTTTYPPQATMPNLSFALWSSGRIGT
jgi:hypothetical protein